MSRSPRPKLIGQASLAALATASCALALGLVAVVCDARLRPKASGRYVALGSSYAAGLGLGPRASGSPRLSMRSVNGYPQQLARLMGLSLVDVSSSGATSTHILKGGQYLLPPQIDAVGSDTELVTLTAGGNDVGYIGDLTLLAARRRNRAAGLVLDRLWKGPRPVEERDFAQLHDQLSAILKAVARRAPRARIIVVTYPAVLPPAGSCPALDVSAGEAELMRAVGEQLAEVTRRAALEAGAAVVDMARLSEGHDACAPEPWVNGARPTTGAPFHPTLAGAQATARQIMARLEDSRPAAAG